MAAPLAHVLRGGVETQVPARELVPGDAVVLRAGDRVPADVRVDARGESRRSTKRRSPASRWPWKRLAAALADAGPAARRPAQHGLRRHARDPRARPGRGRGHRHGDRVRPHHRPGALGGDRTDAAAGEPRSARRRRSAKAALVIVGVDRRARALARHAAARHVHLRHRARRRRGARSAAGGRDDLAGHRRAPHGEAPGAGPPPAGGRDAREHLDDLLRQDRHADAERDDGAARGDGGWRASRSPASATTRSASSAGTAPSIAPSETVRDTAQRRRCSPPTPGCGSTSTAPGASRATPPRRAFVVAAEKAGLDQGALNQAAPAPARDRRSRPSGGA